MSTTEETVTQLQIHRLNQTQFDANSIPANSLALIETDVTATEMSYLAGTTSNVQTQIDTKLNKSDVINNVTTTTTTQALSANQGKLLQDEIDNLTARGRFLALWNCATGLAQSNPTTSPYTYKSGDYYIIGTIATAEGASNYKPNGTTYVIGTASTTVETESVAIDDVYYYDGANWKLQINTQKTVSFANIAGEPTDNTNLKNALDGKVSDVQVNGTSVVSSGTANVPKATSTTLGVVTTNTNYGVGINTNGQIYINAPTDAQVTAKALSTMAVTLNKIDLAVKAGITTNTNTLTTTEQTNACTWLGAAQDSIIRRWSD